MKSSADLRELLNRIDHKGYPAYKDIYGRIFWSSVCAGLCI